MKQIQLNFNKLNNGASPAKANIALPEKPIITKDTPEISLLNIWIRLIDQYFPTRNDLYDYQILWSNRRQKRVLATCNLIKRKVTVAKELRAEHCWKYLPALLHHELCHAVLGKEIKNKSGRTPWHGKEFRKLEALHPEIPALNAWIKSGGWRHAVRSERSKAWHARRTSKIRISLTKRIITVIQKVF